MVRALVLLVPPSLGQSANGPRLHSVGSFDDDLDAARQQVRAALLRSLRAPRALKEKLFAARGELLSEALAANLSAAKGESSPTAAWRRFNGVVWTHLDPQTLTHAQRSRLIVPSALYGVVRASDPVLAYRLGFDANLAPIGKLSTFWRPRVSAVLARAVEGATIVDLLPNEHASAIDYSALSVLSTVHRIRFVTHDDARSVGHDAKAVKGRVARHVLLHGWSSLDEFEAWGWRGAIVGNDAVIRAPRFRQVLL